MQGEKVNLEDKARIGEWKKMPRYSFTDLSVRDFSLIGAESW